MIRARISGLKELEAEIKKRAEQIPQVVANEAKTIIIENSEQGIDIEGKRMKEYTPAYKALKAKHGLPTSPPDLRSTGHLLDRQKVTANSKKSSIRPSVTDTLIAEGNMKHRKFYPEVETDFRTHIPRIIKVSEKAISD